MSAADRDKWNCKYSDPDFAPRKPSTVLTGLADRLPATRGRALDLAGGGGRHSIWLAQQGYEVTLADVSVVGLQVARERAQAAGVVIRTREHDLEQRGLPAGPWDLILSICYLWHPTPRSIHAALAPQGVFVMIQPTTMNLTRHDKPPRDFLLESGALGEVFSTAACALHQLERLHFQEDWSADDRHDSVLIVQRKNNRIACSPPSLTAE